MYGCKNCKNHSCVKENGRTVHKCAKFPEIVYFGFLEVGAVIKEDCGAFTKAKDLRPAKHSRR